MVYHELTTLRRFIFLGQLKLPSQNKPVLALLIHDILLRNIVEPLDILSRTSTLIMQNDVCRMCKHDFFCNFFNDLSFEIEITLNEVMS